MTRQMTATDVKSHILSLLDEVAAGDEVEITKHGRTIAKLVPATGAAALRGRFAGVAVSTVADDELFSTGETWNAQ